LRAAGSLYRNNLGALLRVFLPLAAAFLVVIAPLLTLPDRQLAFGSESSTATLFTVSFALAVIPMVIGGIVVGTAAILLTDRVAGKGTGAVLAFKGARRHLGALIAAGLAATLLSILLRGLLPPVAFFLQPLLYGPAIVVQVIALEGLDLRAALTRAGGLLRKESVRIFMYLFAISLGASLLDVILPAVATMGLREANATTFLAVGALVQILVVILMLPFVAAAMLVAYLDLRASKEDLTLDELVAERGAPA
jgi:hypothetical protein